MVTTLALRSVASDPRTAELIALEREISRLTGRQAALVEIGRRALRGDAFDSVVTEAARLLAEQFGAELVSVTESGPGGELLLRGGVGLGADQEDSTGLAAAGDTLAAYVLRFRQPVIVADLARETRFAPSPFLGAHGVTSAVALVIPAGAGPYGVLEVATRRPRDFVADDLTFLGLVAGILGRMVERRTSEHALRASEARYRRIVETAQEGVWLLGPDDRTTFVNAKVAQLLGYAVDEIVGRSPVAFIDDAHQAVTRAALEQVHQGQGDAHEVQYRRKDGSALPALVVTNAIFDDDGRYAGALGMVTDITGRKQAETASREAHENLRALIESSPIPMLSLDTIGVVTSWNAAAECQFGWTAAEAVGQALKIVPADKQAEHLALRAKMLRGERITGVEVIRRRRDGTSVVMSLSAGPIRDGAGNISGFMALMSDLTEIKRLQAQFLQAQKMEAVGRLAGGVAHDFNNLLTAITGYTSLVLDELKQGDPLRRDLDEIGKAANRAAGLTRQLLAFSRRQVLSPQVLDLKVVVADMDKMLRRLIGEDVDLQVALLPDLGAVFADAGQLEQVIMNLAVNARDAMPQGGRLTIEAANADVDEAHARDLVTVTAGHYVMLAVTDTGVGMTEEVRSHIFEPFFTTKEPGKGTGLGLATVYGIVKQSNGYIWVYTEPGRGTTFQIYLPRVAGIPDAPVAHAAVGDPPRGTETLLLVEDEPGVRQLIRTGLARKGYHVLEAANGGEALLLCERHPAGIHLLVTDVVMPGMGGPDLAKRLAPLRPEMRVLYTSGYSDEAVARYGMLGRGAAFLQKPFTLDALTRKVRDVLDASQKRDS